MFSPVLSYCIENHCSFTPHEKNLRINHIMEAISGHSSYYKTNYLPGANVTAMEIKKEIISIAPPGEYVIEDEFTFNQTMRSPLNARYVLRSDKVFYYALVASAKCVLRKIDVETVTCNMRYIINMICNNAINFMHKIERREYKFIDFIDCFSAPAVNEPQAYLENPDKCGNLFKLLLADNLRVDLLSRLSSGHCNYFAKTMLAIIHGAMSEREYNRVLNNNISGIFDISKDDMSNENVNVFLIKLRLWQMPDIVKRVNPVDIIKTNNKKQFILLEFIKNNKITVKTTREISDLLLICMSTEHV